MKGKGCRNPPHAAKLNIFQGGPCYADATAEMVVVISFVKYCFYHVRLQASLSLVPNTQTMWISLCRVYKSPFLRETAAKTRKGGECVGLVRLGVGG